MLDEGREAADPCLAHAASWARGIDGVILSVLHVAWRAKCISAMAVTERPGRAATGDSRPGRPSSKDASVMGFEAVWPASHLCPADPSKWRSMRRLAGRRRTGHALGLPCRTMPMPVSSFMSLPIMLTPGAWRPRPLPISMAPP